VDVDVEPGPPIPADVRDVVSASGRASSMLWGFKSLSNNRYTQIETDEHENKVNGHRFPYSLARQVVDIQR